MICKSCGKTLNGLVCSHCGKEVVLSRRSMELDRLMASLPVKKPTPPVPVAEEAPVVAPVKTAVEPVAAPVPAAPVQMQPPQRVQPRNVQRPAAVRSAPAPAIRQPVAAPAPTARPVPSAAPEKKRKPAAMLTALLCVLCLVLGAVGGAWLGNRFGYEKGQSAGYAQGYASGQQQGEASGYTRAREEMQEQVGAAYLNGYQEGLAAQPTPPPPTPTPAPVWSEVLRLGARGEMVALVQQRLIELGYLPEGAADGIFGGKTQTAVIEFQKRNALPADGKVNREVYDALMSEDAVAYGEEEISPDALIPRDAATPSPTPQCMTSAPDQPTPTDPVETVTPEPLPGDDPVTTDDSLSI